MFLDRWRKPEYPNRMDASTGRNSMQKDPNLGFEPTTFILQGNSDTNSIMQLITIQNNVLQFLIEVHNSRYVAVLLLWYSPLPVFDLGDL